MTYGQSFAMKHLNEGRYDEALRETDKAMALDPEDPEPVLERAPFTAGEKMLAGEPDIEKMLENWFS